VHELGSQSERAPGADPMELRSAQLVGGADRHGRAQIEIRRVGSRPSGRGPAEWFTGSVRMDPLVDASEPARVAGTMVTFEPGARTAWHTHPLGQTLIVTAGCGWAQREGGPVEEIRPGDVVWIAPGEKHRHGATATTGMTHIAIQEKQGLFYGCLGGWTWLAPEPVRLRP
jgi:quercetin dioxygenase-like cupin family protein